MAALEIVLSHITQGTTYSWDLTALIGLGVPVSSQLRQSLLAGSTTQADADQLRTLVRSYARLHSRPGRSAYGQAPAYSLRGAKVAESAEVAADGRALNFLQRRLSVCLSERVQSATSRHRRP